MYLEKPSQEQRILHILEENDWVNGMYFINLESPITQYHARIWSLQKKGYNIEGRFVKDRNWKEYKLIKPGQASLI